MQDKRLTRLVDDAIKAKGGVRRREHEKPRPHLGASVIGKPCARQIWYGWRFASPNQFDGRMLRLFERGHREEPAFIEWLETIGATVRDIDWTRSTTLWYHAESDSYFTKKPDEPQPGGGADWPDDVSDQQWHVLRAAAMGVVMPEPKQFGFSALWGHFSGSLDGLATGVPFADEYGIRPDEEILVEFKTHGSKSYAKLENDGVKVAKPEHYAQMCTYMEQKQLRLGLYVAVNKDNDELYFEFVKPDVACANEHMLKAEMILSAKKHPPRISNNPTWWLCRFCDHRLTCHYGDPMQKNCRTCRMSQPVENAQWRCNKWNANIPFDEQLKGCDAYLTIHD